MVPTKTVTQVASFSQLKSYLTLKALNSVGLRQDSESTRFFFYQLQTAGKSRQTLNPAILLPAPNAGSMEGGHRL